MCGCTHSFKVIVGTGGASPCPESLPKLRLSWGGSVSQMGIIREVGGKGKSSSSRPEPSLCHNPVTCAHSPERPVPQAFGKSLLNELAPASLRPRKKGSFLFQRFPFQTHFRLVLFFSLLVCLNCRPSLLTRSTEDNI